MEGDYHRRCCSTDAYDDALVDLSVPAARHVAASDPLHTNVDDVPRNVVTGVYNTEMQYADMMIERSTKRHKGIQQYNARWLSDYQRGNPCNA